MPQAAVGVHCTDLCLRIGVQGLSVFGSIGLSGFTMQYRSCTRLPGEGTRVQAPTFR